MRPELRKILDQIDEYLATGEERASQELWEVLSALRGPDVAPDNNITKDATTSVLRAAAFPRTAELSHSEGGRVCASMANDSIYRAKNRADMWYHGDHFNNHVRRAFFVLGLNWNTVNNKEVLTCL
jgi:hypothetical protein